MAFDWKLFLTQRGIPFSTNSHRETRGNLSVNCPMCDRRDGGPESWRMGISTTGKGWHCWRVSTHSGIRPHRLVQAFLKCSWQEVLTIVGDDGASLTDEQSFGDVVAALGASHQTPAPKRSKGPLEFGPDLQPLRPGTPGYIACADYLNQNRHYMYREADEIIERYDLRFTKRGTFRYRIVFPAIHPEGLMSWTGRTIIPRSDLPYRALSADPIKAERDRQPCAKLTIHQCIWNAKELFQPGDTLVLCEGPFDALRLNFYGREIGIRAGCFFGKAVSDDQIALLGDIAPLYKRRVLILDPDAMLDSLRVRDRLDFLRFETMTLPPGIKDPDLLTQQNIVRMFTD